MESIKKISQIAGWLHNGNVAFFRSSAGFIVVFNCYTIMDLDVIKRYQVDDVHIEYQGIIFAIDSIKCEGVTIAQNNLGIVERACYICGDSLKENDIYRILLRKKFLVGAFADWNVCIKCAHHVAMKIEELHEEWIRRK
ncbi:MAG: hypothetical protein WC455_16790 [Dehalococcoidia bacterium]|jgi:hypothetical protein